MATDLEIAFAALKSKGAAYRKLWSYYDGNQPLVYSTRRLREVFNRISAKFTENWCAVVVDSAWERLSLESFMIGNNEELAKELNGLWSDSELDLDEEDIHLAALVTGEAFVIVWKEEDEVQAYYNAPEQVYVHYDPENPRRKLWAVKWWERANKTWQLVLYYPDKLEYYETMTDKAPSTAKTFQPMEEPQAENPYGEVPVFHFRRERRALLSELDNVIPLQDAVNKLLADMMVSAEFAAFRQRYIISNADTSTLRNAPNEIWEIPAGDGVGQQTQVGEFSATDLSNYLKAMDNLAAAISSITRTPRHFFFHEGGTPSGEALIALEAPLNKKCQRYIKRFSATWQRVAAFLLKLNGRQVNPEDITPVFAAPETVQPRTKAEMRQLNVNAGMPLTTVLKQEGWNDSDIDSMRKDKAEELAQAQGSLARALLEQQRRFDQGEGEGEES